MKEIYQILVFYEEIYKNYKLPKPRKNHRKYITLKTISDDKNFLFKFINVPYFRIGIAQESYLSIYIPSGKYEYVIERFLKIPFSNIIEIKFQYAGEKEKYSSFLNKVPFKIKGV